MKKSVIAAVGVICFLCLAAYCVLYIRRIDSPACPREQRKATRDLAKQLNGVVVYQREDNKNIDGIYKTFVGSTKSIFLSGPGRYPRWSPDGRYVAFLRGSNVMHMTSCGRNLQVLAKTSSDKPSLAYNPNGKEILYTDGMDIKAVDIGTRQVRSVVSGYPFIALDISADNHRLVATAAGHEMHAFDLETGEHWHIGRGCSASMSPDGTLLSSNTGKHKRMKILKWKSWEETGHFDPPANHTFDNEFWSNHMNWIVTRTEYPDPNDIFVRELFTDNPAVQVTFTGDCNRPDLYVFSRPAGLISRLTNWLKTCFFL
jgi:dipeptidyl aminopeptidase/acylaminoacyl peptidase